eukprot:6317797-Karenia_brevis.AAC.1
MRKESDRQFRFDRKVVKSCLTDRHEQLSLPLPIKQILQSPADEANWSKLEQLRKAIVAEVEGACTKPLENIDTVTEIARAIEENEAGGHEGFISKAIMDPHSESVVLLPA